MKKNILITITLMLFSTYAYADSIIGGTGVECEMVEVECFDEVTKISVVFDTVANKPIYRGCRGDVDIILGEYGTVDHIRLTPRLEFTTRDLSKITTKHFRTGSSKVSTPLYSDFLVDSFSLKSSYDSVTNKLISVSVRLAGEFPEELGEFKLRLTENSCRLTK